MLMLYKTEDQLQIDLSVWTDGLNTDRVYSGSGKIWVRCILGSGKIRAGVFQLYKFRINPTGLEGLSLCYFFFLQINKFGIFVT